MATRSSIGLINEAGGITYIYCHGNGYPWGVGATLAEHWTEPGKVAQLMELGALSFLGAELRSPEDEDDYEGTYAYHREYDADVWWRNRGGSFKPGTLVPVPPEPPQRVTATDRADYVRRSHESWAEYAYLLTPDGWEIYGLSTAPRWRPLDEALKEVQV